jgi:hypothetical protein
VRARAAWFALVAGLTLSGCGVGTGTLRIAEAEAEIVTVAREIVAAAGLTRATPVAAAPLEPCTLRSGGAGLRTRVVVRGTVPEGEGRIAAAFDAAAEALVARDLVLVDSGSPGLLLAQRDGITITVGSDGRVLELDALTGCRPR